MKEQAALVLLVVVPVSDKAQDGRIQSRPNGSSYGEGWDRIFGKKDAPKDQALN